MLLNCALIGAILAVGALSPRAGYAQGPPEPTRRDTMQESVAGSKAAVVVAPESHAVQLCIDCHGWGRVGDMPAMIIKDASYKVVMMVLPGDTIAVRDTTGDIEPAWIDRIDIVKPEAAVAAHGRGFEQGVVVIVLTPAGSEARRLRRAQLQARPRAQ